ncbi:MAG: Hsp20/alpha crystallin family protein [Nitrospirota bacterium]
MADAKTLEVGEIEKTSAKRDESLWTSLAKLERDMERMVEGFWGRSFPLARDVERFLGLPAIREMPVEMYDDKDDLVVKAELPGVTKQDLEVTLADNRLTISAEKKRETEKREKGRYMAEVGYGRCVRTLELPVGIVPDKAKASLKNGQLEIRLPRTEDAKRREVKISVE